MVLGAIVLLSLAAVFGLSLAVMGARYQRSSLALGLGHAGIGVLGLGLLTVQIFRGPVHMLYNLERRRFGWILRRHPDDAAG